MRITNIKAQLQRPGWYVISIDGRSGPRLSSDTLLKSGLAVGQELDDTQLEVLKRLAVADKAYGDSLRYVLLRSRSQWEVSYYLQRKQVDKKLVGTIIERLEAQGLLNDETFARQWIANRRIARAASDRRLRQELRQKRVSEQIINQELRQDEGDEQDALREAIRRKRRLPRYATDKLRLMRYLSRQGFSYGDIQAALAEMDGDE